MNNVILSADDFGRSLSRNLAIDFCFGKGLITSAALLINSDFTNNALELAESGGYLDRLHCHFNFYSGEVSGNSKPISKEYLNNSLLCNNGKYVDLSLFPLFNYSKSIQYCIEKELEAQFVLFKELTKGNACYSHIDFHLYCNLLWPIAYSVGKFANSNQIKTVRYVGGWRSYSSSMLSKMKRSLLLYNSNKKHLQRFLSYQADQFIFYCQNKVLKGNNDVEVYVHPDYIDGILYDNTKPRYLDKKQKMEDVYDKILDSGRRVISWKEFDNM